MFDSSFFYASAEAPGQTAHHHDHPGGSASHDDRCIAPSRTFLQDAGDWTPFYGSGATHATHHDDQTPHDDSCLIGNGCIGLGLSLDQPGKGMPLGLLPTSGLDYVGVDPVLSRQDDSVTIEYFQSQSANLAARLVPKNYEADLSLLDAASASVLSQASASHSPTARRPNASSPDDAGTEADACSSCDSQCPGSEEACSAGSCDAPCAPCGPCDELTACRDENCEKEAIAPDVAHSAFILHGMNCAARQHLTERQHHDHADAAFHPHPMDPDLNFYNCHHGLPCTQDDDCEMYHHCIPWQTQPASHQDLQPRASTDVFSSGLNSHFGFATHENGLAGSAFNFDHSMAQVAQDTQFHQFGLPVNTQHYFPHATGEAPPQQASATPASSNTASGHPPLTHGQAMSTAYAPNSVIGDISVPTPNLSDATMQGTSAEALYLPGTMIDATTVSDQCPLENALIHSGVQPQHVYKKGSALATSPLATPQTDANHFPSPPSSDLYISDLHVFDSTGRLDQAQCQADHTCQWTVNNQGGVCGQQFTTARLLWDHIAERHIDVLQKTEHGYVCEWKGCERPHRLNVATKIGFHQKSKIKRHMETHTGSVQDYICKICGVHLSAQQALDNHILRHGNLKPHKCTYDGCDYSCRSTTGLTTHIRSKHTKDRRFKCDKCDKTFSDSSNLSKHKRSHSNGRAYVCPKCGSGFNRRDGLCRHAKAVHDMTDADLLVLCPPNPRGGRRKSSAQ